MFQRIDTTYSLVDEEAKVSEKVMALLRHKDSRRPVDVYFHEDMSASAASQLVLETIPYKDCAFLVRDGHSDSYASGPIMPDFCYSFNDAYIFDFAGALKAANVLDNDGYGDPGRGKLIALPYRYVDVKGLTPGQIGQDE